VIKNVKIEEKKFELKTLVTRFDEFDRNKVNKNRTHDRQSTKSQSQPQFENMEISK
jgi:hypothetical protein